MIKRYLLTTLITGILSLYSTILSQPPREIMPEIKKPEEKLEMLKIWKLTDILELEYEQTIEFFALYKQLEALRREHLKERMNLIENLRADIKNDDITESTINSYINQLTNLEEELIEGKKSIIDQINTILTPVQMGKFIVFEETFQEEMLGMIRTLREKMEKKKEMEGWKP